jgi:hypothetical protein
LIRKHKKKKMYNIISYVIFIAVISFITVKVGWVFYKNGEVYIKMLLPNEIHLVQSINKLLLVGYYLLNLGYAAVTLSFWEQIMTITQLCSVLFLKTGTIIVFLALMHYFNLIWLLVYSRSHNKKENAVIKNT